MDCRPLPPVAHGHLPKGPNMKIPAGAVWWIVVLCVMACRNEEGPEFYPKAPSSRVVQSEKGPMDLNEAKPGAPRPGNLEKRTIQSVRLPGGEFTLVVTIGQFGAKLSETNSKWWGGVKGPDGRIYGIPYSATDILIIDPRTDRATRSTMGEKLKGGSKWASGCLGPDGKIYAVPYHASTVLIIDPIAGTATQTDFGLDLNDKAKWAGAVLGLDNKIYALPRNARDILIIDALAGTAIRSDMGARLRGSHKWSGGIRAGNGRIYGIPRNARDILIIDPASGTAVRDDLGANLTRRHKYAEGILAPDGKIYAIPYSQSPEVLIIDPIKNSAALRNLGPNLSGGGWSEAILGPDGNIYAVPYTASDLLVINPEAGTATRIPLEGVVPTSTGKWVTGERINNKVYGIPYGAQKLIQVEFIGPDSP